MVRKSKSKKLILVILILFISIGYAYLTSTLEIQGIGHLKKTVWKIYFDNVNILEGESLSSNPPAVSNHNTTSITYSVNLNKPGDTYRFNIDVVNNGTVDAMVSIISENTILDSDQSKYASYSIKYLDGSELEEKNFLGRHSKETLQVTIKYKKDITEADLPDTAMSLDFTLDLTYMQAKKADSRTNESTIITDLSGNGNDGIMYGGRINADGTVYLDGLDDFIDCGLYQYDYGSSVTYIAKVKFYNVEGEEKDILSNFENAGAGLYLKNSKIAFSIYNNTRGYVIYLTDITAELNKWYTLVGTYDGSKLKLYVDGEEVPVSGTSDTYEVSNTGNIVVAPAKVFIGANPMEGRDSVISMYRSNMIVSDAAVFDRALTKEEVASDYNTIINPTDTTDMLFRYKFSTENKVNDLSGNGNEGTIYGATINSDGTITTDGVDDYIYSGLENYNFKDSITIITRFKVHSFNNSYTFKGIFGNWDSAGGGIETINNIISGSLHSNDSYKYYRSSVIPIFDKWYTVVETYDGSKLKLYINGKESLLYNTSNTYEIAMSGNVTISPANFALGANANWTSTGTSYTEHSHITISDALLFDRAVTKEEVANDYSTIVSPSNRTDLLLYYHFG